MFPATVTLSVTLLVPALAVFPLAFTNWTFGSVSIEWVGLANFIEFLSDPFSRRALTNTIIYVLVTVPLTVIFGLAAAVLIDSLPFGKSFFRAVYFLPVVSTFVAMATVWQIMLHPTVGILNQILAIFGIEGLNWLQDESLVLPVLCAIGIWENLGFVMVLFIAGLRSIPRDFYEAASVDGVKSGWGQFVTVTWPLLGPTTLFVVVISAIRSFRVFESVAVLTGGGPSRASEVLLYTIFHEGFGLLRVGYASAVTLIFLGLLSIVTILQVFLADRRVHY
ncbi:MAG: sugar ABC transporter permease [Microvirga sp.]